LTGSRALRPAPAEQHPRTLDGDRPLESRTSLAIITTTSIMRLAAHLLAGRGLDLAVTGAMTGACVLGAFGGAALSGHVPQRQLSRGFAGLVVAVAAYLLISAALVGGPPGS